MKRYKGMCLRGLLVSALAIGVSPARATTYTYDALGRVTSAQYASPSNTSAVTYSYDAAGNRTQNVVAIGLPVAIPISMTALPNPNVSSVPVSFTGGAPASLQKNPPAHGTASISGLTITYTPTGGYSGADSFSYRGVNSSGNSNWATVTITVGAIAVPAVGAVSASVAANSAANPIALSFTGGGTPTGVAVSTPPTSGIAIATGTSIAYTPNKGFVSRDTFYYTASNLGGTSSPAKVTVNVGQPTGPVAVNDSFSIVKVIAAGTPYCPTKTVVLTANDTDSSGYGLTITSVSQPAKGSAAIAGASLVTYTYNTCPSAALSDTDSFTYTISDGHGGSSTASAAVTITITTQ